MRTATLADVNLMLDWAADEGWNPGLDDAAAFHASDPEGFFVAERAGAPVAAISVVNHDDRNAFLGLYLCRPEWRGQGIGLALWNHALAHAAARAVGLDGVAAQQGNYAKSGFTRTGATCRWQGRMRAAADSLVREARMSDAPVLAALDRAAVGHDRAAFQNAWFAPSDTRRTLVLEDGTGLATVRRCREGCKIGPVIAPDAAAAIRLIRAALHLGGETMLAVDVPEGNVALTRAMVAEGMVNGFTTARMVRGMARLAGPGAQAIATMEQG